MNTWQDSRNAAKCPRITPGTGARTKFISSEGILHETFSTYPKFDFFTYQKAVAVCRCS